MVEVSKVELNGDTIYFTDNRSNDRTILCPI